MRGAASGSEYCTTGGSSGSGTGTGLGAGALAGFGSFAGAGGTTFSTDSSQVGTCSTVCSPGSSGGGALRPFAFPSDCFCAASVARNSSASGPSRIDARFRATAEHLLREIAVHLRGLAGRVVLEDGLALDRRLRIADCLADLRVQHERPEVVLQDLDRLLRMQQPLVEHRRQDADDLDARVQVLANHRQRVLELHEPSQ